MKLALVPVVLLVACAAAGCASPLATVAPSHQASGPGPNLAPPKHLQPAPAELATGTYGHIQALPVVRSRPVGRGLAWSVGSYEKTDSSVTVDWDGGRRPVCGGAYEVRLDETRSSVTIQLVPSTTQLPPGESCSDLLEPLTMSVPLAAPIGSRSILQQ